MGCSFSGGVNRDLDLSDNTFKLLTMDEIRARDASDEEWLIVIHGSVYDVKAYRLSHPGGEHILKRERGKDASEKFDDQLHSEWAINKMKKMKVAGLYQEFTSEQVKKHNTREDCWIICRGQVYDMTKLISRKPEPPIAQVLLSYATGEDVDSAFNMCSESELRLVKKSLIGVHLPK